MTLTDKVYKLTDTKAQLFVLAGLRSIDHNEYYSYLTITYFNTITNPIVLVVNAYMYI